MASKDVGVDFTFIMTCLQHTKGLPKPDFNAVAEQLGLASSKAAYHRHWALLDKWKKLHGDMARDEADTPKKGRPPSAKRDVSKRKKTSSMEGEADEEETSPTKKSRKGEKMEDHAGVKNEAESH